MSDSARTEPDSALHPDRPVTSRSDRLALRLLIPLTVVLVVIVAVFYIFFSALRVDGASMQPTLHDQDMLLLTHGYETAARGDIIAVRTTIAGQSNEIIKRVIALPGDTIEIRDDVAFVNGVREPDRGQIIVADAAVDVAEQVVPSGKLYVMGDNRLVSEDSRFIGPVSQSGVVGRAVALFAPIHRIRVLH